MRISIWQQFSSNNSSDFTVVGVFETPKAAQDAAADVRRIIHTLKQWYDDHPDEANETFSGGGETPSPAEIAMGQRFGFEWPNAVEWYWHASVTVVLDRLVYVTTEDFRPETAGEPFDKILTGLGGQGLLNGDIYGDQIGTILVEITCLAPDEETARAIAEKKLAYRCWVRRDGRRLHFYDWPFSELDLPKLLAELEKRGCTNLEYRLAQAESPEGKPPDPRNVDLLIKLLETSEFDRSEIARDLGEIGDPRAVDALIGALRDPNEFTRIAAARALGEIGDPRAVEVLIHALAEAKGWVGGSIAAALGKIHDPRAIDPLVGALSNDETYHRATTALTEFGETARDSLLVAQKSSDPVLSARAKDVLMRLDDLRTGGALLAALRGDDPVTTTQALQKAVADRNLEALVAYLRNPRDQDTLDKVIEALAEIGDARAIEPLTGAMRLMFGNDRIFDALVKLGAPPVELLIEMVRNEAVDYWMRERAIWLLSKLGDPRALDIFIDVIDGRLRFHPGAAIQGLGKIRHRRATEALIRQMLRSLGTWDPHLVAPLVGAVTNNDALSEATDALIGALQDQDNDENKRLHAAWILGDFSDSRAIQPLLALLNETDPQAQSVIREVLRKLGYEPGM